MSRATGKCRGNGSRERELEGVEEGRGGEGRNIGRSVEHEAKNLQNRRRIHYEGEGKEWMNF